MCYSMVASKYANIVVEFKESALDRLLVTT